MFDPTTEDLWLEVKAAIDETNKHVAHADDLIRRMCGFWYRSDATDVEPQPENFGYAFMSNMLPQLGTYDPKVAVDGARIVGHKTVIQAMEDGLNAWVKDEEFAARHEPVHVDFLVSRGVTLHLLDEDTRFSRGTVTPRVKRISPHQFFADSLADSPETDEFRGHWYWADVDDLRNDPELTDDARKKLFPGGDAGGGAAGGDTGGGYEQSGAAGEKEASNFPKKSGEELGRRRLKCYSVWTRSTNTLRVLCEASETIELYEPRPYYGPPTGPYQLYDAYPVPGQHWPLAPMVAVEDQNRDLNLHARAMGRAANRRKSVGLVEASNPDFAEKIKKADDGEILPVKGITGQHVVLELGGVTQEAYTYTEYARSRLDRISGLTATVQGNVGEADTATEAQIAEQGLSNRIRYLKRRVLVAAQESLYRIGWYMFHTEGIVIPVNRRDPYSGELMEGLFFGGPSPTDQQAQWDDFAVRIRLNTMQQEDAADQNLLRFYEVFIGIAQAAPSMPWVRWMNVLRDLAEAFNVDDKPDEWLIPELFGAIGQPPQTPPSRVIGGREVPPRAGQQQGGQAGGPAAGPGMAGQPPGPEGFAPPGGSGGMMRQTGAPNQMTRSGSVGGPNPRRGGNPMRAA